MTNPSTFRRRAMFAAIAGAAGVAAVGTSKPAKADLAIPPPPRTFTFVVAAADTVNAGPADLICSGVADDVQITNFIASKRGIPCNIFFRAGRYSLNAEITVDTSWVTLEGELRGNWLKYSAGNGLSAFNTFPRSTPGAVGQACGATFVQTSAGKGAFRIGTTYFASDTRHKSIVFDRLSMWGPSGTGTAILDPVNSDICQIKDCNINGFQAGIDVAWDNPLIRDNNVQDTMASGATGDCFGIRVRGVRGHVSGNCVFQVGQNGIWVAGYGCSVTGNTVGGTTQNGILITGQSNKVVANAVQAWGAAGNTAYDGIVIANFSTVNWVKKPATGNVVSGNTIEAVCADIGLQTGGGSGHGIHVGQNLYGGTGNTAGNSDYNIVQGNFISDDGTNTRSGFAINLDGPTSGSAQSSNCLVMGNVIRGAWNSGGATKINAGNGTGNVIANNAGTS